MVEQNDVSQMDYNAHEQTYTSFIKLTKLGTITLLTVVICLALIGFGGGAGALLGSFLVILCLAAFMVGMAVKNKPALIPLGVLGLSGLCSVILLG
ncbi:aa3-type cytochrome c oxidase subunit IV [Polycladidibacter stylochi]|uniref:aa3-type cytochrome c oxidase subunit IV n=1 Tax=Polycladidibacter stylochi TaxID=1807766 RepID=UPI0008345CFF|nr:aa3-type cytochrome c oxidase subunit IV [Pseudovibrio stylochi]